MAQIEVVTPITGFNITSRQADMLVTLAVNAVAGTSDMDVDPDMFADSTLAELQKGEYEGSYEAYDAFVLITFENGDIVYVNAGNFSVRENALLIGDFAAA